MSLQHYVLKCLLRHSFLRNKKLILTSQFVNHRRLCSSSSDSSDEENETPKSKSEIDKEMARTRMKGLLSSFSQVKMGEEFRSPSASKTFEEDVDENEEELKIPPTKSYKEEDIKLKEETKNKMMNLLSTFNQKTYSEDEAIKITQAQPRKEEKRETDGEFIDFSVKKAVKDVVDLLGGDEIKKAETESELLQSLRSVTTPKLDLSGIISEMKKTNSKDFETETGLERKFPESRLYEFRRMALPERRPMLKTEKIDVFGAQRLNIFPEDFKPEGKESVLSFWDSLNEREMKFSVSQPPRNYFEEMINWTEEGKVWTFPIDNEIGLEEEKSISFADHIFLENHLSEWCPKKGPIRHFMELVCVGLSKNPYLTVNRKKAHIEWYRNYFDSKKDLLQDIGAL